MNAKNDCELVDNFSNNSETNCLVVMRTSDNSNILYFTPSSEHEQTDFDTTDLHIRYYSIDFSADRRLV